ncbi:DNA polymerase III subunit delta' [Campylobacter sp. MIT 99-7217]|uniref:DNA polymerase III subunit delta' n=1 Tax=Campylobacter sp. MIT 99-7217 TaxID=535091 RepID=UPI0021B05373|nr:DNA polymerase III subunit delta' [Campylobacter sp. MIT 99-7217]
MLQEFQAKNLRFIPKEPKDEFLIDDAREVQKESYIAETDEKIIIIMANSFRVEAQNFLLKLFEEPPKNIKFLLVAPSKNLLLPTVRSRFICEVQKLKKEEKKLDLNIQNLDLKEILNFLKNNENLDKLDLMQTISTLSTEAIKELNLSEKELELFFNAYELARLNSKPSVLLSTLLLSLYEGKK